MRPKVRSIFSCTCTWLMRGSRYSTGSSTVMILRSGVLISSSAAYSVVVLPLPVGPVTRTMPLGPVHDVAHPRQNLRRHAQALQRRAGRCSD